MFWTVAVNRRWPPLPRYDGNRCADHPAIYPLQRTPIEHVLDTGVRPINACLPSGAGSVWGCLPGRALVKCAAGDDGALHPRRCHCRWLIGERGREVKDFIENILGAEGVHAPW